MLTVTVVRLAVSHHLKIFKTKQKPVMAGYNQSLCPKITLKYSPVYELSNNPKIIIFGSELTGLWVTEIFVTFIPIVTSVMLHLDSHVTTFSFLQYHHCLSCRAHCKC